MKSSGLRIVVARDHLVERELDLIAAALTADGFVVERGPQSIPGKRVVLDSEQARALLGEADVVVGGNRFELSRQILREARRLRGIVYPTIGVESLDFAAAEEFGLIVGYGPSDENVTGMAEATIMLILNLLYDLRSTTRAMEAAVRPHIVRRSLMGKAVGLVGFGRIGHSVAERLKAFGCRILVANSHPGAASDDPAIVRMPLSGLLAESDVVSLHATIAPENDKLMGAAELALMKPTAFLVNTARGRLVDEQALYEALRARSIAGAALDAFAVEPLPAGHPFRLLDNVILTPHQVGHTVETMDGVIRTAVENVADIARGEPPRYCKNPDVRPRWEQRLRQLAEPAGNLSITF